MPGPEVVAEEAPVLIGLDMAINAIIVVLFLWALKTVWKATFEPIILGIADATKINAWKVHIDPLDKLRKVDAAVLEKIDEGISTSQNAMGFWFHQTARMQGWVVDETWKIARDTLHFGEWVVKTYGPLLVKTAAVVAFPWVKVYRVIDSEIERYLPKVKHGVKGAVDGVDAKLGRLLGPLTLKEALDAAAIAALWTAFGALAGALPHGGKAGSLPHGIGIPKSWTKWRSRVDARLRKLEGLFGATAMAAAMANVFRVTPRCLRSGNIGRLMRHVCGVPSWLLDLLILGTIEAFIASDLCAFSDLLIKQAEALRPALMELVDVEDALIDCGDNEKPIVFKLPPASLPPLQGVSPLAA